jgi:dynein light chain 1
MSNNACKDWGEFSKLQELPLLEDLLFVGNPLEETHTAAGDWRKQVANRLKGLKKLDGKNYLYNLLSLNSFFCKIKIY